ncbi:unnamed protein product [Rotaria socialis]|uniref:[histone H3]-lysine(27) N-trimethyltransferase n=3 Tax=Rotaria TaxID=231623 RepID=A0A817SV54_9BILA|nr:unnamed protein product [Rotaria socialis]CAF4203629.1 unnamed protein product [Rotaria socialis]
MRETRNSNNPSQQQLLNDKKSDVLRQAVEHEYTKLFRQAHKTSQKAARNFLRQVAHRPPPSPITIPIPKSTIELKTNNNNNNNNNNNDGVRTLSVTVSDGANQRSQKHATIVTMMPSLSSVRELISYVPTLKNIATRGELIGIPYLGDTFDREDQELINSISGESSKQNKAIIRKNKLDEPLLETLYETLRSNKAWQIYSNEQIIDVIIDYHRDATSRARLIAFANQSEISSNDNHPPHHANIDTCDTIDIDINNLIIKAWCSRFCLRCYTYNCLLHTEKPSHLQLPKQFCISNDHQSSPCCSTCYKHEREYLKRSVSPSHINEQQHNYSQTSSELHENVRKRQRKSTSLNHSSSSAKFNFPRNENLHTNQCVDQHYHSIENQKKLSSQNLLTRIENHMITQYFNQSGQQQDNLSVNNWTLTDRSLFRLFYFVFHGDLCLVKQIFHDNRTCKDMYQQFIVDAKYFSERISLNNNFQFSIRQPYRRKMLEGATRSFLFHIKKNMNSNNHNKKSTLKPVYQPCLHDGPCVSSNKNCSCMKNGTYCEKYCNCSIDCPHRFPGCACKGACLLNNCLCCAEGRECDPDLCHKCGASLFPNPNEEFNSIVKLEPEIPLPTTTTTTTTTGVQRKSSSSLSRRSTRTKINENLPTRQHSLRACRTVELSYKQVRNQSKRTTSRTSLSSNTVLNMPMITCANIGLQRKSFKQILVGESDVAGYGAFLGSPVAYPGDLIAEYTGEIISEEEADRRGRLYDKQACSYLFNLDSERCVDARQFGSKIRFANHSSKPNCVPKVKLVNGDYRIGIYAKQTIFQGDELFFEYMYDAHHRQQFVNNERVEELEQDGLTILKRYGDNFILARPSYD